MATNTLNEVIIGVCDKLLALRNDKSKPRPLGDLLTHEVEVDAVVNKVIFVRLHILGSTEVYTVLLANVLDLFVGTS